MIICLKEIYSLFACIIAQNGEAAGVSRATNAAIVMVMQSAVVGTSGY